MFSYKMVPFRKYSASERGSLFFLVFIILLIPAVLQAQILYQQERPVTIIGYSGDAMEPFISGDGQTMFFNSLNDGVNTSIYHASRINDTTFQHEGVVLNVNQPSPHLDAVVSMDQHANFYWVSLRDYPNVYQNLMRGTYTNGVVTNISHVYGDFYVNAPGWLVMDACITNDGKKLIYCNAYFNNCNPGLPCEAYLGMAVKTNDTTFNNHPVLTGLFQNINDTSFLVYAPQLSSNGLELYYTRLEKNTTETQICLSVRSDTNTVFPPGAVLYSNTGNVPEAPTITSGGSRIYYHRKSGGTFRIFTKERIPTDLGNMVTSEDVKLSIDRNSGVLSIISKAEHIKRLTIVDTRGAILSEAEDTYTASITSLSQGTYFARICTGSGKTICQPFIIIK